MQQADPIRVVLKVTSAFDQLGIPYLIGGSLASAVHGIIRSTMDGDLVADMKPEQVLRLTEILQDEFYIDSDMIFDAIVRRGSFNLIHLETMFKVDVFVLKDRPFDRNEMDRRILQVVGDSPDVQAFFSTAEDIILAKLEWYRSGGETSERQWRDIIGVIGLQSDRLDFPYLKNWAIRLGVDDLLQRSMHESGLGNMGSEGQH